MKSILLKTLLISSFFALVSCEGSDAYRGDWKALNVEQKKFDINFTENEMHVINEAGEDMMWGYSQNSIEYENSTLKYGINLENGLTYSIVFPRSSDEEKALILNSDGTVIFTIGRTKFYDYQEVVYSIE